MGVVLSIRCRSNQCQHCLLLLGQCFLWRISRLSCRPFLWAEGAASVPLRFLSWGRHDAGNQFSEGSGFALWWPHSSRFGVGGASNLTPICIFELAPPAIRRRLVGPYELGWQAGGLVGDWINVSDGAVAKPSDCVIVWCAFT